MKINEKVFEIIGVSQEYIIPKIPFISKKIVLYKNIHTKQMSQALFDFELIKLENREDFEVYKLNINPFYKPLKVPKLIKNTFSKIFPMSAIVVTSNKLNIPLGKVSKIKDKKIHCYCYSFLNQKTGPSFFGFGPGKFEKAFKHYTLENIGDSKIKLTLTSLISPRSKKVLNIMGFDPIYGAIKFINAMTLFQFRIYKKFKIRIETQMMKHHVNVHEEMLKNLLQVNHNQK